MADTVTEHLRRYNQDFKTSVTKADLQGKWLWQAIPEEHHGQLAAYLSEPDFFADLPLMPDVHRVLETLAQDHEIFIASAAMEVPTSFTAKFNWIARHFTFIRPANIVFCGDKSILNADFLIDDNPRQLRAFRGQGLLFSAAHNRKATEWPRMDSWPDVERYFRDRE